MKPHTKPVLRAMPAAQVQISPPVQGVLRDARHAFPGLCIDAGQKVLGAMMEADRIALCGRKGVPHASRHTVCGGSNNDGASCETRLCDAQSVTRNLLLLTVGAALGAGLPRSVDPPL